MRPLILKMQAFGPFAGRETVDFRRALASGLFGIYGATGAGKSSIFSAMTFALFGEAARGEQAPRTLRSDHAEPDTLTEVELIFELGERRYRIVRRPDQMRPAKRGGGETEEKHKAWLFDLGEIALDDAGDANPGKPIAERKVSLVDEAITGLLGYEATQFRQIVLLPQGRFEAFLNAKTDDRVKILRDLCDVSVYRHLTEYLKERSKKARDEIRQGRDICEGRIRSENFDSINALANGVVEARNVSATSASVKAEAEKRLQQANAAYQEAAQTDKFFKEHADAQLKMNEMQGRAADIEGARLRLSRARLAQALAPKAAEVSRTQAALVEAAKTRDEAAVQLQAAEKNRAGAADALRLLEDRVSEFDGDKEREIALCRFKVTLEGAESLRRDYLDKQHVAEEKERALEAAAKRHDAQVARQRQAETNLQMAYSAENQRVVLTAQLNDARSRLKSAQDFEKAQRDVVSACERRGKALAARDRAAHALDKARGAFSKIEVVLLESHALHLAAHLEPGAPCPVCGSTDHPAPAVGRSSSDDLGPRYREAKAALDEAQADATANSTALAQADAQLEQREAGLQALPRPEGSADEIASMVGSAERELGQLPVGLSIEEINRQAARAAEDAVDARVAHEGMRDECENARRAALAAKTRLESAIEGVPEQLRAGDRLDAEILVVEKRITDFSQAREQAREAGQKADAALSSATTALQLAETGFARASDAANAARTGFLASLDESGLTDNVYETARADISQIEEIEAIVRAFGEELATARDRLKRAEQAIAESDRPDITAHKDARDLAEKQHKDSVQATADATARLAHLEKIHRELIDRFAEFERLEADTAPLRDLAAALSGDNGRRTDLETFAIATMFGHVLAAANLRLEPMTRGRYRLVLEREGQERGRRGLDILVEDSFTGSCRPTATLSGGETFIAALALALGLSDIVESTRGNVRLDAIFIDEGFGSLDAGDDAGTLDQVLQSLMDLVGKQRAVGLISHVPLVQQTVQNGFWVSSTASGSRIEERI